MISLLHRFKRFSTIGTLAVMALAIAATAYATHFRGNSISWAPTGIANQVKFNIKFAARRSAFSPLPNVGSAFALSTAGGNFVFGDGTVSNGTDVIGTVTSVDIAEDWFLADLSVTHTYPASGSASYVAYWENCCRISTIKYDHDSTIHMETSVFPRSGNTSPVTAMPVFLTVPLQATTGFAVAATDINRDTLRYRLSTTAEMFGASPTNGSGLPLAQPPGLSVNSSTGQVTWTTGAITTATGHAPVAGDLWAVQFMVEDLDNVGNPKSKVPVDLILKFVAAVGTPPTLIINPPGPFSIQALTTLTFTATGNSANANARVQLNATGVPQGASVTNLNNLLAPPVVSTFTWTPTATQGGSFPISFTVTDDALQQTIQTVSIFVEDNQPPTISCPVSLSVPYGQTGSISAGVADPNGDALTVVWQLDGSTVQTDSVAASQGTTTVTLSQTFGTVGSHTVYVTVTDPKNASANCTVPVTVSNAVTTTSVVLSANSNQTYGQSQSVDLSVSPLGGGGSYSVVVDGGAAVQVPVNVNGATPFGLGSLAVGSHTVTATYSGDSSHDGSTGSLTFSVVKANPLFQVNTPAPYGYGLSSSVIVTFQTSGNQVPPSGTVSYQIDGGATQTVNVNPGPTQATLPLGILTAGTHAITWSYSGDGNFNGVNGQQTSVTVNQSTPSVGVSTSPVTYGSHSTFTVTVSSLFAGSAAPSGMITYQIDGGAQQSSTLGSQPNSNQDVAIVDAGVLSGGSHTLSVSYNGDSNFTAASAPPATLTVNRAAPQFQANLTVPTPYSYGLTNSVVVAFTTTGGQAAPTGTISFHIDNGATSTVNVNGNPALATLPVSVLSGGSHTVFWSYSGDGNFTPIGNNGNQTVQLSVNKVAPIVTIVTSGSPTTFGDLVTFTATVQGVAGGSVPTGIVSFKDGNISLGPGTLDGSGTATFSTTGLSAGTHIITGAYTSNPPDPNYSNATSSGLPQVVNPAATTTTISSNPNPSAFGNTIQFIAQVSAAANPAGFPQGSVSFQDNGVTIFTTSIGQDGRAFFSATALAVGSHPITATFTQTVINAAVNFGSSTSSVLTQVMTKGSTNTTVNSSSNPSTFGSPVTFTATVTRQGGGATPTGTVTFTVDGTPRPAQGLDGSGHASFTTNALTGGGHNISASYSGDGNYNPSSNATGQFVNQALVSVALSSSANPSNFATVVTFTAHVAGPIGLTPTGNVTFRDGATVIGTGGVSGSFPNASASLTTSTLSVGTHPITATYNGDLNFTAAVSPPLNQIVSAVVPSFSQILPMPAGACICTPLLMNSNPGGTENWYVKAGSSLTLTLFAHAVNDTDPETVQARVFDPTGAQVGTTLVAAYPAGSPDNTEVSDVQTFATSQDAVYRVEIATPNTSGNQPHYRLKFDGAQEVGTPAPTLPSFEDVPQSKDGQWTRWVLNAGASEQIQVGFFTNNSQPSVASQMATHAVMQVFDTTNLGVPVPLVDTSNAPLGTTLTLNGGDGITTGVNQVFRIDPSYASAATTARVYLLVVEEANGHYKLNRGFNDSDRGIYLTWHTGGQAIGNVTLVAPAGFPGVTGFLSEPDEGFSGQPELLTASFTDTVGVGHHHLTVTAPAGYTVTPTDFDFTALCDVVSNITITVTADTTTTISAPDVTYNADGAVTVAVGSVIGGATGTVSLSLNGGAPVTQPLSGGTALFTIAAPNAGDYALSASYAAQGDFGASSATGTLHVGKAPSITTVTCPPSGVYTGSALTPCSVTVTGAGGLSLTPTPVYTNNVNVGTAGASYAFAGDANHDGSSDTKSFAVTTAPSITTVTCLASVVYNGSAQTPCTVTVTGAGGLSLTPTPTYTSNMNVGTASAGYTFAGDANHDGSSDTKSFAITKAPSITTVTCAVSVVYTGLAQTPCTVAVTGAGGLSLSPAPTYGNNVNAGTASASYTFTGDANHDGSSDAKSFAVTRAPSSTTVTCPVSVVYTGGAQTACTAAVTGAGGLSLLPAPTYGNNVNVGTASASYTFAGDANHDGSSDAKSFAITKAPSITTVSCPAGVVYTGLAETPCTVAVTGVGGLSLSPAPTYGNNVNAGTASASYTFTGDANHDGSSDAKSFAITKALSVTTVTCPAAVVYSGLPQTPCTAAVTGPGGLSLTPSPTYGANVSVGTATASYTFGGDANHTGSADSKSFGITKAASSTSLTASQNPSAFGQAGTITATITAPNPHGGTVTFTDGATTLATIPLGGSSQALFNMSSLALGPHTITAVYSGDANVTASTSAVLTQLVYAYAAGTGGFVIGDTNAVVGQQVTFWGAQWSTLNTLSGGGANASFKGFANTTSTAPVAAGGTWTSGPGNSSGAPASVPTYMAVIVSSTVTKSGSTISGNIPKMVVVRTDAGYANNPGHDGTGTVVAVIH